MSTILQDTGKWKNPDTGIDQPFSFEYKKIVSFEDAIEVYGSEAEACRHLQRMNKTDARNTTASSEKARAGYGRAPMSEEEKLANKTQRKATNALASIFKGKTADELIELGVPQSVIDDLNIN